MLRVFVYKISGMKIMLNLFDWNFMILKLIIWWIRYRFWDILNFSICIKNVCSLLNDCVLFYRNVKVFKV